MTPAQRALLVATTDRLEQSAFGRDLLRDARGKPITVTVLSDAEHDKRVKPSSLGVTYGRGDEAVVYLRESTMRARGANLLGHELQHAVGHLDGSGGRKNDEAAAERAEAAIRRELSGLP